MNILTPKIDQQIAAQVKSISDSIRKKRKVVLPNITISREFGCEGYPLASALKKRLDSNEHSWNLFSRDLLRTIENDADLKGELESAITLEQRSTLMQDLEYLLRSKPSDFVKYKEMGKNFKLVTNPGGAIVVGAAGAILAQGDKNFFNIRLTAPLTYRVNRVSSVLNINQDEAKSLVEERGASRKDFIKKFTGQDVSEPAFYHLVINNDNFDAEEMADIVLHAMKLKNLLP